MNKNNNLDFRGTTIFCGLDVHLKSWRVNIRIPSAWNRSPIEKLKLKITTKSHIEFRQARTEAT